MQVTSITAETLEVRLLCSANDPETQVPGRFRVSEHMMAHLRDLEGGRYLPKQRLLLERSRRSDH